MPVLRYFLVVGSALLTLLFVANACLPTPPATQNSQSAVDLSIIRIHSNQKWPERVVFDTSHPTIVPAPKATSDVAMAVTAPAAPSAVASPVKKPARDALAQAPANVGQPHLAETKQKRKAAPKGPIAPPTVLAAQQPHYVVFGNNIW